MLREILATLKARPAATLAFAGAFGLLGILIGTIVNWNSISAKPALSCEGEYADSLQMRDAEPRLPIPRPAEYTYLVRNTARYECPYFGPDGKLRRRIDQAKEHGTAFAYEVVGQETYLLTNEHVAVWPEVTDARNRVTGVSDGCKRVEAQLRIVNDERDEEEVGQIPLKLVTADARLDAAVLKAPQRLPVLPYKIGRSAALRQGNAVEVRGFPLGLLHAVNTGKVVNPYDHDVEQGWDHVDFVVDALLSEGNSGSPVLALSCATGKLELVGMYHAGYKDASALNVVVGIDQVRDFMTKKRRIPRASPDGPSLTAAERRRLEERLDSGTLPIFHFGGLTVVVEKVEEGLRYHLYGRGFPLDDRRAAVLEDRPAANRFGELSGLIVRGEGSWRAFTPRTLGEEDRDLLGRAGDALRLHILKVLEYRRLLDGGETLDERRLAREIRKGIERQLMPERELTGSLLDLIERLAPQRGTPVLGSQTADASVPAPPALSAQPLPASL
jgi:hypothetical protein